MIQSDEKLRRAVADLLGAAALPCDAVVDGLLHSGVDPQGDAPARRSSAAFDTSFTEVSAGVLHIPSVLEGTSWTVWVDADDASDGFVRTHPHLSPMAWWLIEDDVPLLDDAGQPIDTLETDDRMLDGYDTDVVIGPDEWLDGMAGGWRR